MIEIGFGMMIFSLRFDSPIRNGFAVFGALFLATKTCSVIQKFWNCFSLYCAQSKLKKEYFVHSVDDCSDVWAAVTGPHRGLGKAFTYWLADNGFSLVLIGRQSKKLLESKIELQTRYPLIKIKLIKLDLSTDFSGDPALKELFDLNVSIFINNAGVAFNVPEALQTSDLSNIQQICSVNCFAPAMLIHVLLANRSTNNKLLVINIGSVAASYPLPLQGIYSASKIFLHFLSRSMSYELEESSFRGKTSLVLLTPSYVLTDMTAYWYSSESLICPSANAYVASSFNVISNFLRSPSCTKGTVLQTTGWLFHEIQSTLMTFGGELTFSFGGLLLHKFRRNRLQLD